MVVCSFGAASQLSWRNAVRKQSRCEVCHTLLCIPPTLQFITSLMHLYLLAAANADAARPSARGTVSHPIQNLATSLVHSLCIYWPHCVRHWQSSCHAGLTFVMVRQATKQVPLAQLRHRGTDGRCGNGLGFGHQAPQTGQAAGRRLPPELLVSFWAAVVLALMGCALLLARAWY